MMFKKLLLSGFVLFSFLFYVSCDNDTYIPIDKVLIDVQEIGSLDSKAVEAFLKNAKIDTTNKTIFGLKAYRITYWTYDDNFNKVKASGLFVIPDTSVLDPKLQSLYSFPMVSDQHGTIFLDSDAPSNAFTNDLKAIAGGGVPSSLTFTTVLPYTGLLGFATVMPDYIGYGESKDHYHPYMLENSLSNAVIDMIRASIEFAERENIPMKREVYLAGYSEGGYATMAAAKKYEKIYKYFKVKGVVPMAGVYNLEKMGLGLTTASELIYPPFLAYMIYAYSETYKSISLSDLVHDVFVSQIPPLFDKTKDGNTIYGTLFALAGKTPGSDKFLITDLFKPEALTKFTTDETFPFRKALRDNSVEDWTPTVKMLFIHCGGDNVLPQLLAYETYQKFLNQGAKDIEFIDPEKVYPNLVDPDGWNHSECAPYAYKILIGWLCVQEYGAQRCN
ncbi:alpha/beta hydrolase family protein [Persephonella sp.]